MAIEDKDLARLAEAQTRLGRPVTAADLVGARADEPPQTQDESETPPPPRRRGRKEIR